MVVSRPSVVMGVMKCFASSVGKSIRTMLHAMWEDNMTGLYCVTYLIGEAQRPETQMKISEMFPPDSSKEAIALVKTKHPTDLVRITSVAMLKK